jgi:hypothetical protein
MSNLAALSFVVALSFTQAEPGNRWNKAAPGPAGDRTGAMLVATEDPRRLYLVGPGKEPSAKDGSFVQAFDPVAKTWTDVAGPPPGSKGIDPYYQTAYDPGTKTIYCLSGGSILYAFDTVENKWKTFSTAAELDGLAWHTMACDSVKHRLVVVGADKKADNLGWSRTVVFDIPTATWKRFDVVDASVQAEHRKLVAAKEAAVDLVGRIRLAWYRDPNGIGNEAELASLRERCVALGKLPRMDPFGTAVDGVHDALNRKEPLPALKMAHALQRQIEERAEERYPVPSSRRNSPLAFDPTIRVFVLFGGDHEDYLMNDTWVLDLDGKGWRRTGRNASPSPRAGHALVALPGSGKIALFEGYVQSNGTDYSAGPSRPIDPAQLWLFDAGSGIWELAGAWPLSSKGERTSPPAAGRFYGYTADKFSPPALAADKTDTLVLATAKETWTLHVGKVGADLELQEKLGSPPNARLRRTGPFAAAYCEVADKNETGIDDLPENRWVKLPPSPRNPAAGCRQRDWSTSVWDSDREQILLWGGGHCVRSSTSILHYSPTSGRMVEGYDADEPYGGNGGGGFDSSLLGRPWVSVHNYKHYAYDPKSKLLVSGRGYLYDPERMDWLRQERLTLPYHFEWGATVVAGSKHGVVAWAKKRAGDEVAGLWLFDKDAGWTDLQPVGKLFVPWCDSHGMVYDTKRDRMIFSCVGGGYGKRGDGSLLAFDFATKTLSRLVPENAELNKTNCAREQAYVDHADWMLIGEQIRSGEAKTGPVYTRIYDCARNKMFLLDAGPAADGHEAGWMYDARRKLVYAFSTRGDAWALKLEPKTAKLVER